MSPCNRTCHNSESQIRDKPAFGDEVGTKTRRGKHIALFGVSHPALKKARRKPSAIPGKVLLTSFINSRVARAVYAHFVNFIDYLLGAWEWGNCPYHLLRSTAPLRHDVSCSCQK